MNKTKIFLIMLILSMGWSMISCTGDSVSLKEEDLAQNIEQGEEIKATQNLDWEEEPEEISQEIRQQESPSAVTSGESVMNTLFIHIRGAVKAPGVYKLPAGSRVFEAVTAAGGFAEEADEDYVNLVLPLEDGCQLTIPTKEQTAGAGEALKKEMTAEPGIGPADSINKTNHSNKAGSAGSSGTVNLNTADISLLCTLPGIGETRAEAIIAYREANGGFKAIEDIMQVEGIKEGTFKKLKDKISVQ